MPAAEPSTPSPTSTPASEVLTTEGLATLARSWAVLLRTRKRDGSQVGTPVNIAFDGPTAYIGTPANTGKVKRLRNFPDLELAACTPLGRPTGPSFQARARLLEGEEADAAERRLRRKYPVVYGVMVPLELRAKGTRGLYYELTALRRSS